MDDRAAVPVAVNVRTLRANLAQYLTRASGGERIVVVTTGGRRIAQLGPVQPLSAPPGLDDLVADGLVLAPARGDRPPPEVVVPARAGARIDRLLAEIRG